jgi:hypothetical protein
VASTTCQAGTFLCCATSTVNEGVANSGVHAVNLVATRTPHSNHTRAWDGRCLLGSV